MSDLGWIWWLPWTVGLSAIAVVAAWRAWCRRDLAAVLRRSGYALVPWAVLLLGLYGLVTRVASAAALWAGRFVFDPTAWLGVATGLVATALIVLGGRLRRLRLGSKAAPSIGRRPPSDDAGPSDVEAILRKHGIN